MSLDLNKIYHVYLIGIGGIGMSALARYFHAQRIAVAGYDLTPSPITKELEELGIDIHYREAIELVPPKITQEKKYSLVIYTPAIPSTHKELNWLKAEGGVNMMKRSEVLGLISAHYKTIAVSGTHGKTTTSSMIAHVMNQSEVKCHAFLGGIATNFNSNLLLNDRAEYAVVEADEFDRSFLTLSPSIAVTTSVDADHLDIYGEEEELLKSFQLFVDKISDNGVLFYQNDIELNTPNKVSYGLNDGAFKAENIQVVNGDFIFNAVTPKGIIDSVKLGISGLHNIENAMATIAVCQEVGIPNQTIKEGLASYAGVKRRFEYQIKTNDLVFIDDYAHHPNEIKALVSSVKRLYPGKKITGVFQPHLFSRTRDFIDEFATQLSALDEVLLLDIYPAREEAIEGVTSEWLKSKMTNNVTLVTKQEIVDKLITNKQEIVLTIGAGDIGQLVTPIKEALSQQLVS